MAKPVTGLLSYDPVLDRPTVLLQSGKKRLLTEDDTSGGGGGGAHASTHENGGTDEIDVGGLQGELADPQKVEIAVGGVLIGTSNRINLVGLSAVDTGTDVTVTGGGGAAVDFELVRANTALTSYDEIAQLIFASAVQVRLKTLLAVAVAGQTCTLVLRNLTDSTTVTTLTTTSTLAEEKDSGLLTLPASDKLYALRLTRTGGDQTQRVSCYNAHFEMGP